MEKTQSLLAALFGWFIGSFTMWRLGFDTLTALIGGLLTGAPLAYIAYDLKAFGVTFKQQSMLATTQYRRYVPHVEIPSFKRALQLASTTVVVGLVACLWMIQACIVVFWVARGTGDDMGGSFFVKFLGAFAWTFVVTFLCVGMLSDSDAPWSRWVAKRETKNALIGIAILLGPLNMVILLTFVGLVVLAIVTLVVRGVTIRVCSSGRLIAMASAIIGLVLEWSTGSIAMGLGGLFVSFALQWLALHKWAVEYKERGDLLTW